MRLALYWQRANASTCINTWNRRHGKCAGFVTQRARFCWYALLQATTYSFPWTALTMLGYRKRLYRMPLS